MGVGTCRQCTFVLIKYSISFNFTYQDEYTVNILHAHCFLYISYLGTDEENLFNIKDLFFLSDHVLLLILGTFNLYLINLSDVLTL